MADVTLPSPRGSSLLHLHLNSAAFSTRTAIVCGENAYRYSFLLSTSTQIARSIARLLANGRSKETDIAQPPCPQGMNSVHKRYGGQPRVGILCENDATYVCVLWAIWQLQCIAVPLCKVHPNEEQRYVVKDSGCSLIITSTDFRTRGTELAKVCGIRHLCMGELGNGGSRQREGEGKNASGRLSGENDVEEEDKVEDGQLGDNLGAMIVYTSGTTGRPKGVLLTHSNIRYAQRSNA